MTRIDHTAPFSLNTLTDARWHGGAARAALMADRKFTDAEVVAAIDRHGSMRAAAKSLGVDESSVRKRMRLIRGTSTLYNEEGARVLTWVKSDHKADEKHAEVLDAIRSRVAPLKAAPAPKRTTNPDLLNCYVLTDFHLGMLAWGEETGADWDIATAEATIDRWIEEAIARAPKARVGVLAQLGDFLHYDSLEAVTPTSGHVLDADTRFVRMIGVARRALQRCIDRLLRAHEQVVVLHAEGNHDIASSAWLRELFAALYANEPRVRIITRPDPYYCVEHGKTLLLFHHGHKRSIQTLDTVLAAKFRSQFGKAEHVYAHTGHFHHLKRRETALMVIEQHRTLAAPDAYASRGGWISGRSADVITYCSKLGERCRVTVQP